MEITVAAAALVVAVTSAATPRGQEQPTFAALPAHIEATIPARVPSGLKPGGS